MIWVLIYVDDILVTGNNGLLLDKFIKKLYVTFSLKDLGPLSFFLRVEVHRSKYGLHLS